MRRISFALPLVVIALLAVVVSQPAPLTAQTGTPTAGSGFVGAWRLTASSPGSAPTQSLATFMADGTYLDSDLPVSPAGGGAPATLYSAGHGIWQQTGATAQVTFVDLVSDLQGHFLASETISVQATLGADGQTFSGAFRVTGVDPRGTVRYQVTGTVRATRITLQPLATPAA